MEELLDFKFELNLRRLCSVKVARLLWENENIKEEIVRFHQAYRDELPEIEAWNGLSKRVLTSLKDLLLPVKLKRLLNLVTHSLGLKIFNWTVYVVYYLELDASYTKDIFWTHYGTIDTEKIFKFWVENQKMEPNELFFVACHLCMKEYLVPLWNAIPDAVRKDNYLDEGDQLIDDEDNVVLTIYKLPVYSEHRLVIYWLIYLMHHSDDQFTALSNEDEHFIVEVDLDAFVPGGNDFSLIISMLEYSRNGHSWAMHYFWSQLNDQEREQNLEFIKNTIKYNFSLLEGLDPDHCLDFIVYMIKKDMYSGMLYILETLVKHWPWEEFFTSVFDYVLCSYDNPVNRSNYDYQETFYKLIHKIVDMMKIEFSLYDSVNDGFYQSILHEVWRNIPESVKSFVAGGRNWSEILNLPKQKGRNELIYSKLLNIEDFKSLRSIINHRGFQGKESTKRCWLITHVSLLLKDLNSDRKNLLKERFVNEMGLDNNDTAKLSKYFRNHC